VAGAGCELPNPLLFFPAVRSRKVSAFLASALEKPTAMRMHRIRLRANRACLGSMTYEQLKRRVGIGLESFPDS
jgi:hypothetical protein